MPSCRCEHRQRGLPHFHAAESCICGEVACSRFGAEPIRDAVGDARDCLGTARERDVSGKSLAAAGDEHNVKSLCRVSKECSRAINEEKKGNTLRWGSGRAHGAATADGKLPRPGLGVMGSFDLPLYGSEPDAGHAQQVRQAGGLRERGMYCTPLRPTRCRNWLDRRARRTRRVKGNCRDMAWARWYRNVAGNGAMVCVAARPIGHTLERSLRQSLSTWASDPWAFEPPHINAVRMPCSGAQPGC